MLFCKDCRHSEDNGRGVDQVLCKAPQNFVDIPATLHPVSGDPVGSKRACRSPYCVALRGQHPNVCGPDAVWFESKIGT